MSKIEDHFKLPIFYTQNKNELKDNIITDLELVDTMDASGISMYQYAFQPKTEPGKTILREMPKYYSDDVTYLKETQKLLKTFVPADRQDITVMLDLWKELKNDTGFKEKYHYIDWSYWEYLNGSETFLQAMCMYNMASPVLSLFIPIIILIIPFFIIKSKGLEITLQEYIEVLKVIAANHAIGKMCTHFNHVPIDQKIYLLVSTGLYFFSIYQNILTCLKFHKNMKKIHESLLQTREYIQGTMDSMNQLLVYTSPLGTYGPFNESLRQNIVTLAEYNSKLSLIQGDRFSLRNIQQVGYLMKCFYELHINETYNNCFLHSFGFHGYIENISGLLLNIREKKITFATFKKKQKTSFIKSYYTALIHDKPIKNTIRLDKNIIITGPNASGKTTTLKTMLINVIFTQQFGCGFYESANIKKPYKHIHCYLNIPDTSGRDSLFQAEARRCKEIIDIINNNKKDAHFCVFDELYSGTNPEEAVMSANAFMEYLVKFKTVTCLLTTHFIEVCKKLDSNPLIENMHMETKEEKDSFAYTYLVKKGISYIRGGIKVLHDMQYPQEIIDSATQ